MVKNLNLSYFTIIVLALGVFASLIPLRAEAGQPPVGWLDSANCDLIAGWAMDPDKPDASIPVHIWKDGPAGSGTYVGWAMADKFRPDILNHAFVIPTPDSLFDGRAHDIYIHGIDRTGDANGLLSGLPKKIQCGTSQFSGPGLEYFGYYFVEDSLRNVHYLQEVKDHSNLAQIPYYPGLNQSYYQKLSNDLKNFGLKMILYLDMTKSEMTNASARRNYLTLLKYIIGTKTDLIDSIDMISLREEWYTLLDQGEFDHWKIFQGKNINQKRSMMKILLEEVLADIKSSFPNKKTIIVENTWNDIFLPPDNLDILGIDAYYIPENESCDSRQRRKFDQEVTSIFNWAGDNFGRPMLMVGGVFKNGKFKMPSACQIKWYYDLAFNKPEIIGLNWFLYSSASSPHGLVEGIRENKYSEQRNYIRELGLGVFGSRPEMHIDGPLNNSATNGNVRLGGWAIDQGSRNNTPGITTIHVWAFPVAGGNPIFAGIAEYGISRPDVANAFGKPKFKNSGYGMNINLPSGTYNLRVSAFSNVAGRFNNERFVRVTVN